VFFMVVTLHEIPSRGLWVCCSRVLTKINLDEFLVFSNHLIVLLFVKTGLDVCNPDLTLVVEVVLVEDGN
jgi:hypothetical protein